MHTVLDRIIDAHRRAVAERLPPLRDFRGALARPGRIRVIAEVKRRSPSKGDLAPGLVASTLAKDYEAGGADCLSVLTDAAFFGGSADDLREARAACSLPVLRKDFVVSEIDVVDARLMGADAVLLIVAALSDDELVRFHRLAEDLGMAALVEVHDAAELDRALAAGASIVGVNQRDLRTFEVDRSLALRLAERMPEGVLRVAESGIRGREDVERLEEAGYDAVLVGESLVTSRDPSAAVRELKGV